MRDNEILEIKGRFTHAAGPKVGPPSLPKGGNPVTAKHLRMLAAQLKKVKKFWESKKLGIDPLVGVLYNRIVAKSNRVHRLFSYSTASPNDAIVGARFDISSGFPKHQITYSVPAEDIDNAIDELNKCAQVLDSIPSKEIDSESLEKIMKGTSGVDLAEFKKTQFGNLVRDAYYVEKFCITKFNENIQGDAIVSLYRVSGAQRDDLLRKFGIEPLESAILEDAVLLQAHEFATLSSQAPYLIAMADIDDISSYEPKDFLKDTGDGSSPQSIPSPTSEPEIGVIDTGLCEDAYFADEWVKYENLIEGPLKLSKKDKRHGTAVTSIIVDGPSLNPDLDDGCGRFRVRHFCVALDGRFSSFSVMKKIVEIVKRNPDIKVWNLSLGSELAVRANSISPEAAILDRLQYENNIVFVVAGTNDSRGIGSLPLGAPADSINSLVVNSVDRNGVPSVYSRKGPVLSFFAKPDVSYFGGDSKDRIRVASASSLSGAYGTSVAAPWITRKMAYLVEVMKMEPQVAKALLIHSATTWEKIDQSMVKGYGVVPKRIEDILYVDRDEIRFVLTQKISGYKTYNYHLPIPHKDGKYPFKAKATLCYFPLCSRNQGVDYTDSEVTLTFGRIGEKKKKTIDENGNEIIDEYSAIIPINNDSQDIEGVKVSEKTARQNNRKWDNVKHIGEVLKSRNTGCKKYKSNYWGISFTVKERLDEKSGQGLRVGLVVTLKEVNGINRLNEFRNKLELEGWLVNEIDMHARAEIVERATIEEIEFEG